MTEIEKMRSLDQFYTQDDTATECIEILKDKVGHLITSDDVFLEPSAGKGAFIDAVNEVFLDNSVVSYDIDPKREDIIKDNFLEIELKKQDYITIGNPPFGKRSKLALAFFDKTMEHSKFVAFIVPIQFNKWLTQSKVNKDWKLIHNEPLESNSFTFNEKDYSVRSTFQIWTRLDTEYENTRLTKAPATTHEDFMAWQHNNTEQSLKYFDYDWDFAVVRQGYGDYNEKHYDKDKMSRNKQFIFFKAKDQEVLERLKAIDFEELSMLNTSTPGFGKADLIKYYVDKYEV